MAHFETPRFPDDISYGSAGGPTFQSTVFVMKSGHETRNLDWPDARCEYDAAHGVKSRAQMRNLISFFRTIGKGRVNTFRYKDWFDYYTTLADQDGVLGSGFGNGEPTAQCYKRYLQGAEDYDREINKLVSSTFLHYLNGVLRTVTTHYSVNANTGLLTFVPLASAAITGISQAANGRVTTSSAHGFLTGELLYLASISGMTQLNGQVATITEDDATHFLLNINTTGMTAYSGGGTAAKYPQPADQILWVSEYDVRVRFDIDRMVATYDGFDSLTWGQIPLVETREDG